MPNAALIQRLKRCMQHDVRRTYQLLNFSSCVYLATPQARAECTALSELAASRLLEIESRNVNIRRLGAELEESIARPMPEDKARSHPAYVTLSVMAIFHHACASAEAIAARTHPVA